MMLSLFEDERPSGDVYPFYEHAYRVKVEGPEVGMGGCGVVLWHDTLDEANAGLEAAMREWPGRKIAHLELRTVLVAGPKHEDRQFVGFTPLRVSGYNPEVRR